MRSGNKADSKEKTILMKMWKAIRGSSRTRVYALHTTAKALKKTMFFVNSRTYRRNRRIGIGRIYAPCNLLFPEI